MYYSIYSSEQSYEKSPTHIPGMSVKAQLEDQKTHLNKENLIYSTINYNRRLSAKGKETADIGSSHYFEG